MDCPGTVMTWRPPFEFAYEEASWSSGAPPLITRVLIEPRDNTCMVRMTHRLLTERKDWDGDLEGMEKGWETYIEVLRIYLRSFPGEHAASARPAVGFKGSLDEAWKALQAALGLTTAVAGESIDTSIHGAPRLAGIVENATDAKGFHQLTIRVDQPAHGVAIPLAYEWAGNVQIAISLYFYGDDADAVLAREQAVWSSWLEKTFKPA